MSLSYEYSVGSIKAKENSLLSKQDLEMLVVAESLDAFMNILRDKGYDGDTVESMLENKTAELWQYIKSIAPEANSVNVFLYRNDLHNIKATIKGVLSGRPYEQLLLSNATIDVNVLRQAVEKRKFSILPEWLAEAAESAYEVIAHNSDSRLGDAILDKAAMSLMLKATEKLNENIKSYFKMLVFYNDVKVALRAVRTTTTADYIRAAVCEVEGVDLEKWVKSAVSDSDEMVDLLSKISLYGCETAIKAFKKSPSEFEKCVDNMLIAQMRKCRYSVDGIETIFGYIIASEAEIKLLHIIASGIRTGAGEQFIRERLRDING